MTPGEKLLASVMRPSCFLCTRPLPPKTAVWCPGCWWNELKPFERDQFKAVYSRSQDPAIWRPVAVKIRDRVKGSR